MTKEPNKKTQISLGTDKIAFNQELMEERHRGLIDRIGTLEDRSATKEELRSHYITWQRLLTVAAIIAAAYAYVTPLVVDSKLLSINEKIGQLSQKLDAINSTDTGNARSSKKK